MGCMLRGGSYSITRAKSEAKSLLLVRSRALAAIKHGLQVRLFLGNLGAMREWGHARDFGEGMWLILQQDDVDDSVLATNENSIDRPVMCWFKFIRVISGQPRWIGCSMTPQRHAISSAGITKQARSARPGHGRSRYDCGPEKTGTAQPRQLRARCVRYPS